MPQLVTPGGMRGAGGAQPGMFRAQIIDVGREPQLKAALLSGRLEGLTAPFMYHDPAKQLAFVLMPMEMGMADVEQQRTIGQMTQNVMRSLPQESPKGYLLQPRTFFTFQSLIEAVLAADGISPDVLRKQQEKADLLRDFLRQSSVENVRDLILKNDDKIDAEMFDLLSASIDANSTAGREQVMQSLMGLQQMLVDESTFGKTIGARMAVLEAFQKDPTRENLLAQLLAAPDAETRESLVAMGRQLLDYAFFQTLTQSIDGTVEEVQKNKLIGLRKEVQETRDKVDAANREYMQAKIALIQEIAGSKDPQQTAREHEAEIDDTFVAVIQANAQEAQKRGDKNTLEALQLVYNIAMQLMTERQPPEVQLVNALLQAKYPDDTAKMLNEIKNQVDDRLLGVMSKLADQLAQNDRTDTAAKLTQIMVQARSILPKYDPATDPELNGGEGGIEGGDAPPPTAPDEPPSSGPTSAAPEPPKPSGLIGPDGLIRGPNAPSNPPPGKIEIARR